MSTASTPALSHQYRIDNAHIPGYEGLQRVRVDEGVIESIQPMATPFLTRQEQELDLGGDWLSLGGIDLQINGALGLAFPDLLPSDQSKLQDICQFLWQQGVDGFLPTLVTTSIHQFQQALSVLAHPPSSGSSPQAQILGVHLEGPCLNAAKRGAHPQEFLQPLTRETLEQVMGNDADLVKVITLAPELDPSGEVVSWLRSQNIIVSLGHSLATAEQAQTAFEQGATLVTHALQRHAQPSPSSTGVIGCGSSSSPSLVRIHCRWSTHRSPHGQASTQRESPPGSLLGE